MSPLNDTKLSSSVLSTLDECSRTCSGWSIVASSQCSTVCIYIFFSFSDNGFDIMSCLSGIFLPSRSFRLPFLMLNPSHPLSSSRLFGSSVCLLEQLFFHHSDSLVSFFNIFFFFFFFFSPCAVYCCIHHQLMELNCDFLSVWAFQKKKK